MPLYVFLIITVNKYKTAVLFVPNNYLKSFKFETSLPKLIIKNSASKKINNFSNCWRETFYIDALAAESFGWISVFKKYLIK